jgi:phosphatidylethanolamine-binding protein (PEBP) family uncharacterized protein
MSGGSATGGASTSSGGQSVTGGTSAGTGGSTAGTMSVGGGGASGGSGGSADGGASSGGAAGSNGVGGSGGQGGGSGGGSGGGATGAFKLSSPSWQAVDNADCTADNHATCPLYPKDNTSFGTNVSPEMSWTPGPSGTQSYAIVLKDLSINTVHWAIWDIPASTTMLPAMLPKMSPLTDPAGAKQVSFSGPGYYGSGACKHVYEHRVYALNVAMLNPAQNSAASVNMTLGNMASAVLAQSYVRLESRDYCN